MPIRNPFAKKADGGVVNEENRRPANGTRPTFEKVDTVGSKASSSMSISTGKSGQEVAEYKMSGMFCEYSLLGLGCPCCVADHSHPYYSCQ